MTSGCFSADYRTARERLLSAASPQGWNHSQYPLPGLGPSGEALAIDVLTLGASSSPTLVLSSGLHGVEGFFGSAVQLAWVQSQAAAHWVSRGVRIVLLHALNPCGFAWSRRFDAENIDPNRNFLLPDELYSGSPARYADLDRLINPPHPPSRWDPFWLRAIAALLRFGEAELKQAVAGGQYDFPRGLFFGGRGPSQTMLKLAEHWRRLVDGSQQVVHFDFHTGLGRWGTCKLLLEQSLTEQQHAWLCRWYGADSFEETRSQGVAYQCRGGFLKWCAAQSPKAPYLGLCAEFGTYSPLAVLAGLRAENQAHYWGDPASESTRRAKARLRELFCPAAEIWRMAVIERSLFLVDQSLRGLTES
jgi:hypothetical protein